MILAIIVCLGFELWLANWLLKYLPDAWPSMLVVLALDFFAGMRGLVIGAIPSQRSRQ